MISIFPIGVLLFTKNGKAIIFYVMLFGNHHYSADLVIQLGKMAVSLYL
jgi:hypothetical protein